MKYLIRDLDEPDYNVGYFRLYGIQKMSAYKPKLLETIYPSAGLNQSHLHREVLAVFAIKAFTASIGLPERFEDEVALGLSLMSMKVKP